MAILVTCPKCHHELDALDEHAGRKVCCANCNAEFMIPGEIKAPHDVIISYSSKDKKTADAACFVLEKNGIRCWMAPRDIAPGKEWGGAIIEAIGECRVMLLIFSSSSDQSQQVRREVERAVAKAKPIIPLRIENVPPSESMEYFLSNTHWLDAFTGDLETHLEKMSKTIHALLHAGEVKAIFVRPTAPEQRPDKSIPDMQKSLTISLSPMTIKTMIISSLALALLLGAVIIYSSFSSRENGNTKSPGIESAKSSEVSKIPAALPAVPSTAPEIVEHSPPNGTKVLKAEDPARPPSATKEARPATKSEGKVPGGFEMLKEAVPDSDGWASEIRHRDTGIEMVYVAPGEFMMGSPSSDKDRSLSESQHMVKLTEGFYIGKYEVTQGQWEKVMGKNPSHFKNPGGNAPVEMVSWNDCQSFCKKLGTDFGLPTEGEWEYAARGGNRSKGYIYSGSNNLDEVGWYYVNSDEKTHPVGQMIPNELGIYDMSGNVWEWCSDCYSEKGTATVPSVTSSGSDHILRGGSWLNESSRCQFSARDWYAPGDNYNLNGIRIVVIVH